MVKKESLNSVEYSFKDGVQFDIDIILQDGSLKDELEYERALNAENELRILSKEYPELQSKRKKLIDLLVKYESEHWSFDKEITDAQFGESDIAEEIAERERVFVQRRKEIIREKLKAFKLTQQDLGFILGHKSKSYMSELMNGIYPFSLKDLVVIHRLLNIKLSELIPLTLPQSELQRIRTSIRQLARPGLGI